MEPSELLSTRVAAAVLGVSTQSIAWSIRAGHLVASRDERGRWQITPAALDAFKARKAHAPVASAEASA